MLLLEGSKLWAYNATSFSWVNRTPIGGDRPIPRARPAVAWHPVRNELFVFGGSDSGTQLSDLWAYDSGARTLPALRWRLPLQASGESLATISSLLSFNVASRAAGVGYAIGSPVGVNGSRLDVWDTVDGSYTALSGASNNAAPVGAPGTLNGTRSSHATIRPLLFGADESLFLRVAPIANAGNRGATNGLVELDAIDATLRYRLP